MRLAPETNAQLEQFFREFFCDGSLQLPEVEIYIRNGARIVTALIGVDGITLGRHIFIRPSKVRRTLSGNPKLEPSLLAHEVTHVIQYQKLGFIRFLKGYLNEYIHGIRKSGIGGKSRMEAYFNISHEIEARRAGYTYLHGKPPPDNLRI